MKNIFLILGIGFLTITAQAADVTALKQEITVLAKANTTNVSAQSEVRKDLDNLISELTASQPEVTEQQWVKFSPGSWRQIWSDEADNSPAGSPSRNLDKIFQYVSNAGRAVNFGERRLPNGVTVTFALEAVGAVSGNKQNTKILKGFSRNQGLVSGEYISQLATSILEGDLGEFEPAKLGEFPKGPINAESDLTILYLDDDLKIGTAPNVYTGAIELFVLERVISVQ